MQSRRINCAKGNLGLISLDLFIGQAGLGASDKFIRVTYHTIEELNRKTVLNFERNVLFDKLIVKIMEHSMN